MFRNSALACLAIFAAACADGPDGAAVDFITVDADTIAALDGGEALEIALSVDDRVVTFDATEAPLDAERVLITDAEGGPAPLSEWMVPVVDDLGSDPLADGGVLTIAYDAADFATLSEEELDRLLTDGVLDTWDGERNPTSSDYYYKWMAAIRLWVCILKH